MYTTLYLGILGNDSDIIITWHRSPRGRWLGPVTVCHDCVYKKDVKRGDYSTSLRYPWYDHDRYQTTYRRPASGVSQFLKFPIDWVTQLYDARHALYVFAGHCSDASGWQQKHQKLPYRS
jgi:hypothetical protein